MSTYKPPCVTVFPWLRENLGKTALAPLTSTDVAGLRAAIQVIELYQHTHTTSVLDAFAVAVNAMQSKCQVFAYHAIAHLLDWNDRAAIWRLAMLPDMIKPGVCAYEPGGSKR